MIDFSAIWAERLFSLVMRLSSVGGIPWFRDWAIRGWMIGRTASEKMVKFLATFVIMPFCLPSGGDFRFGETLLNHRRIR
jgi:hypothetical protein